MQHRLIRKIISLGLGGFLCSAASMAHSGNIGTELWQKTYNTAFANSWNCTYFWNVGFTLDGNILVTGSRGEYDGDSAIGIRYDSTNGDILDTDPEWFLWEDYSYPQGSTAYDYSNDRFYDLYIDGSGNIYFAGISYAASYNSWSTRWQVPNLWKYSSTYNNPNPGAPDRPMWRKYHLGSSTSQNGPFNDIAVDSSGNIYLAGWFNNSSTATADRDWFISKYDSDGNLATGFPIGFSGEDNLHDYTYDIAVDSEDNFVVVGMDRNGNDTTVTTDDHNDWMVRKYSSDGTLLWTTTYDHASGNDTPFAVAIDSQDNIIVGGYRTNGPPNSDTDWYLVKYAKDGDGSGGADIMWEQYWDDGSNAGGVLNALLLDANDNIYLAGYYIDSTSNDMARMILQYRANSTGALLKSQEVNRTATYNNLPNSEDDYSQALALDDGKLVLSGYTNQRGTSYNVRHSKSGRVVAYELLSDITPSVVGSGTITPSSVVENVEYNTTESFNLSTDPSNKVEIGGTCPAGTLTDMGGGNWQYTTGNVVSDCTVQATFTSSFFWGQYLPAIQNGAKN